MLLAACSRSFSEPILTLLNGLAAASASEGELPERAASIVRLGHHSGLAILLGVARVLRAHMLYFKTCPQTYDLRHMFGQISFHAEGESPVVMVGSGLHSWCFFASATLLAMTLTVE